MNRLPFWFKQAMPDNQTLKIGQLLRRLRVNTVCSQAKCPNTNRCFSQKSATFLILGDTCTRNCRFCAIKKSAGTVLGLEQNRPSEPSLIAEAVRVLGLKYVVITSVTRDDLTDGGASVFAETIRAVRLPGLDIKVEVLIPDFKGKPASLECILHAGPDVLSHNIETVERLYPVVRPMADYRLSLALLKRARELSAAIITKSSLMLGLGEQEKEVRAALSDLRQADCDFLTLGQYLAPSLGHYPVQDFIPPEKFRMYAELAADMGFRKVSSGPLVRSSYQAQDLHQEISYV